MKHFFMGSFVGLLNGLLLATSFAAPIEPLSFKVPAKLPDRAELLPLSAVRIDGWLGARIDANEKNRLLTVDTVPLLAGYHKRPGNHPWIGEHVGKWLHAATLAWAYTGDPALKEKLDRTAAELIGCQEPDGYLGTYLPDKRFGLYPEADWDVWSHKYNLIGLLTYYRYTGNESALSACRKMGDLLIRTFPTKRSILAAGTHVGMAATSVLEPMVLLYRTTGDERYLDFARYIVQSWDEPNGPQIMSALLRGTPVNRIANAKAYEMLSNLVGLCELARVTGDRRMLEAVLRAWSDVVKNRLYLTGSMSAGERFQSDYILPNDTMPRVCETCVTTTWIQLNLQLLRLTGQAKFGDELERALYNHQAAAQHPRGDDWCYYTALEGKKPYDRHITCCHSSGPRGMALAPLTAYLKIRTDGKDVLAVDTFETSRAAVSLDGQPVTIQQQSEFPRKGVSTLTFHTARPAVFGLKIRVPAWADNVRLSLEEGSISETSLQDGWLSLPARTWHDGDRAVLDFDLSPRLIAGDHGNAGRDALAWGPFVLAYDHKRNPGMPAPRSVVLTDARPLLTLLPGLPLQLETQVMVPGGQEPQTAIFSPFADAGSDGGTYGVWLLAPGTKLPPNSSLLAGGEESRSRQGNVDGAINDGNPDTFVVTFNGEKTDEDWFAVTLSRPATIGRIVFSHGANFHDGGWFDAGQAKPWVQIQRQKGGDWETVGRLSDYPSTTATDAAGLVPGRKFTLRLPKSVAIWAVRVLGVPACGDNSRQAFSSCSELQAFKPPPTPPPPPPPPTPPPKKIRPGESQRQSL
ncbi:MAG: glycoside hydrolase family 127 protein [Pirellulales bacterium]|nr:glycoside hydrolase family 127 protein [Pirellulales bacterium]